MMNKVFKGEINHVLLQQELIAAIGSQDATGWYLSGSTGEVTFVATKATCPDPTAVINAHIAAAPSRGSAAEYEAASAAIDAQRDAKLNAGVLWKGKKWYTDNVFQAQITARVASWNSGVIPLDAVKPVRAMDGSVNMLSYEQHKDLALALLNYVEGVYGWSWTEKAKL